MASPGAVLTGAVLAGGSSRRMGRPKAMLDVGGRPMVLRVADALAGAGCATVFVVGGDRRLAAVTGLEVVPDRWPGEGPLGGVIVALEHAAGDVVVAACDLPDLDPATVGAVVVAGAGPVDAAVAAAARLEPALARWNRSALAPLLDAFEGGERSLHGALTRLRTVQVAVDAAAMRNVNRPGDLDPTDTGRGERCGDGHDR